MILERLEVEFKVSLVSMRKVMTAVDDYNFAPPTPFSHSGWNKSIVEEIDTSCA